MTAASDKDLAALIAATEVAPAEARDLSALVESHGLSSLVNPVAEDQNASELLRFIRERLDEARVEYWLAELRRIRLRHPRLSVLPVTDSGYPQNLRECYDRPPLLFVDGSLHPNDTRALAVVGSRVAHRSGLSFAAEVARASAQAGLTIVSGLARGIDGEAHRAALEAGGRTMAVLGSGIDSPIYPPEHSDLADEIRRSGALISTFRPAAPPTSSSFVARNAVISGLSLVSLLVEASERSGTRTEAESAVRQGRQVLLWAPALAGARWAQLFSRQPGVRMVSTIREILEAVTAIE
jgi:DNA processing protein